jgi:hypothetical protein
VRPFLLGFLVPVHIIAEVGAVSVSARHEAIATDTRDTTATAWQIKVEAAVGKQSVMRWVSLRAWRGSRVVYEHIRAYVEGDHFGWDDLAFPESKTRR